MTTDTAFTIMAFLDKAERTLGDVRLYPTGGTLRERLDSNRQTLALARRHLDEARALA
ncbi:hypothetical protein [Azospirillum sp. TSO22-1]|uniref:hypothetical protein n=1 Tax=Azospirillum sp. TSO22-1 TaxID=716789 RepID=UPI001304DBDD|nr:hypothetical protein [Azospirillum sp. TSO22-1]